MAGTTPVTTLKGAVISFTQVSRQEFGSIWTHSIRLTKSRFIKLVLFVGKEHFRIQIRKRSFQSTITSKWSLMKILQPWLSQSRP